jgi:ketosteroid isomerase-like protein
MSRENIEVIRRAIESLNASKIDPDCYDPEVEYTTQPGSPTYTTYRGVAGLERSLQSVSEAWTSIRAEAREFIQEDQVIVAVVHFQLRAHSGVELDVDQGWAWWMRNGKIRRVEQYGTKAEALEAAGLSE